MSNDHAGRFARYLNGRMTPAEASTFERELDEDTALAAEFERWSEAQLPQSAPLLDAEEAQVDLVRGVEARIRRRSQGRFFSRQPAPRPSGLALPVFLALSIVVMLVAVFANLDRFAGAPALDAGDTADERGHGADDGHGAGGGHEDGAARRRGGASGQAAEPVDGTAHGQTPLEERDDYGAVMLAPTVTVGRVSNDPIIPMVRRGPVTIFTLDGDEATVQAALEERFGAHRMSGPAGDWVIRVDRAELPEAISRLSALSGSMSSEDRELTLEDLDRPAIHVRLRRR